jgi:hypothetical protein
LAEPTATEVQIEADSAEPLPMDSSSQLARGPLAWNRSLIDSGTKTEDAGEPTMDELEASEEEEAIGDAGPSWN